MDPESPIGFRGLVAGDTDAPRTVRESTSAPRLAPRGLVYGVAGPLCVLSLVVHAAIALAANASGAAYSIERITLRAVAALPTPARAAMFPLVAGSATVGVVAVSPDGRLVAAGGEDGVIDLWGGRSGDLLRRYGRPGEGAGVSSLAFSPDGRLLAAGDAGGVVVLWRTATGSEVGRLRYGHDGSVIGVAFDRAGKVLVSASADGAVRLWDASNGKGIRALRVGGPRAQVALSDDARFAAVAVEQPVDDPTYATRGDARVYLATVR